MPTEKQILKRWGRTHHIKKIKNKGAIDLGMLKENESITKGDETFYFLLTKKEKNEQLY